VQESRFGFVLVTILWQGTAILLNFLKSIFVTQVLAAAHVLQAGLSVLLICKPVLVENQIFKRCLDPTVLRVTDPHGLEKPFHLKAESSSVSLNVVTLYF